jgi:hypothetical protein
MILVLPKPKKIFSGMINQQKILNLEVFRQNSFFLDLFFSVKVSNTRQELKNVFKLLDQQENLNKHLIFLKSVFSFWDENISDKLLSIET